MTRRLETVSTEERRSRPATGSSNRPDIASAMPQPKTEAQARVEQRVAQARARSAGCAPVSAPRRSEGAVAIDLLEVAARARASARPGTASARPATPQPLEDANMGSPAPDANMAGPPKTDAWGRSTAAPARQQGGW